MSSGNRSQIKGIEYREDMGMDRCHNDRLQRQKEGIEEVVVKNIEAMMMMEVKIEHGAVGNSKVSITKLSH